MSSTIETLAALQQQHEAEALEQYRQIVRAIARDESPAPEDVEPILRQTGKTLNNLQSDVFGLKNRIALRKELDGLLALKQKAKEAEEGLKKISEELQKIKSEFRKKMAPLEDYIIAFRRREQAIPRLKNQLEQGADPTLRQRMESLFSKQAKASRRAYELYKKAQNAKVEADSLADRIRFQRPNADPRDVEEEQRLRQLSKDCLEKRKQLEAEVIEIQKQAETLQEQMLEV